MIAEIVPLFAAVGYSLCYLLLGGGFGCAFLIFIGAKMLGKLMKNETGNTHRTGWINKPRQSRK